MELKKYISEYLGITVKSDVQNFGMADSVRPGTVSFLENPKFVKNICDNPNIIAVFVKQEHVHDIPDNIENIVVKSPKATLFTLHNSYCKKYQHYPANVIAPSAVIHPSVSIAETGVVIGENVTIGPNTTILSGVEIGANTTIGANCVLGDDGMHVFHDLNGIQKNAIHDGWLKIGNNVNIKACVEMDKGFMGRDTIIGDECCFDNFVHIAHRVHIGAQTIIACASSIAGTTDIGKEVWIGAHCVISNRLKIGDKAKILIGSVVIDNVNGSMSVSGNFALPHDKHLLADARAMIAKF